MTENEMPSRGAVSASDLCLSWFGVGYCTQHKNAAPSSPATLYCRLFALLFGEPVHDSITCERQKKYQVFAQLEKKGQVANIFELWCTGGDSDYGWRRKRAIDSVLDSAFML